MSSPHPLSLPFFFHAAYTVVKTPLARPWAHEEEDGKDEGSGDSCQRRRSLARSGGGPNYVGFLPQLAVQTETALATRARQRGRRFPGGNTRRRRKRGWSERHFSAANVSLLSPVLSLAFPALPL